MAERTADPQKVEAFGGRLIEVLNHASASVMLSLGHRTGLFDVMSELPPATSVEIAIAAGLSERYVREWLGAMFTAGIVTYDPDTASYALPPEHAALLTRAAGPNGIAHLFQYIAVLGAAEDQVLEAFKHGRGVPYSAYPRFHEVMAEDSNQSIVSALEEFILPLEPTLLPSLERGVDVLDVGCGSGRAIVKMARKFPASRFKGYDLSEQAVRAANLMAEAEGLSNVRFETRDCSNIGDESAFDVVFTFDAVHDQGRPDLVLQGIRRALRPGGLYFMQDIKGSSHVQNNADHPVGTFIYTASCMHCMSVSLAQEGGMGLGAMWGKEKALEMLEEAGFKSVDVKELPHDFANYYYLCR
jgi:2-polyprenyl-3-methyl-5-hydroxy-6-metoxy-1,4-benzoquinol methylase